MSDTHLGKTWEDLDTHSTTTAREALDLMKGPNPVYSGNYHRGADLLAVRVEAALAILDRYRPANYSGSYDAALVVGEIQRALDGVKP